MEFWTAIVGPLTSAGIGLFLSGVEWVAGGPASPDHSHGFMAGYINLTLAVFNLIPGYPLDGGRILRALMWWKTGDVERSTRMAATVGRAVAIVFISFGMLRFFGGGGLGGLWIAFIGWFLLQAASESYRQISLKRAIEGVTVGDVMTPDCPTVNGDLDLQHFVEEELLRTGRRCFVVLESGAVAGLVTPQEVKQVERGRWPFTALHDIMRPLDQIRTATPETPLSSALEMMSRNDVNQLPVVSNGHIAGVLSRANLLSFLQTRAELQAA